MVEDHEKAKYLAGACKDAFQLYQHDCSHAVWHVIRQYKPDQPYMQANHLVSHLFNNPQWKEVQLWELSSLANQGILIVGGLQGSPHGHVIVVYPGPEKPKGGYYYTDKETGETRMSPQAGMYARAMSTSISKNPFPGSISMSDKTVRDPWPAKKFEAVKFWKYVGQPQISSNSSKEEAKKWRNPSEEIWI